MQLILFALSWYCVVTALIFQSVNGMINNVNQNKKLYSNSNGDFSIVVMQDNNQNQNITISTNFGESWRTLDTVPDEGQWTSLVITESNQIVVATVNTHASTSVYKSDDFGKSWKHILKGFAYTLPITTIASSKSVDLIYVGCGRNVTVSADNCNPNISLILDNYAPPAGDTIIQTSTTTGQYTYVLSYSYEFSDDDNQYDDKRNNFLGVAYKSFDFGLTWQPISQLSQSSSRWKSLYVSSNGQQVLISRGFQTVLLSLDYGDSFVNIIDNIHAESVDVLETNHTSSGCNTHSEWDDDDCSGDTAAIGGAYYVKKDISEVTAITMSNNGFHIVIAAKCNDISRSMLIFSHDRGQSWSKTSCDIRYDFIEMTVGDKGERIIGVLADGTITVTPIPGIVQQKQQQQQQQQQITSTDLSSPVNDKLNLRRRSEHK